MKTLRGRQYSFTQQTQIKLQNKALGPLASIMNHSLTEATLQLPFSCMGRFSSKVVFPILKSLRGRHYSLIQQTQFTMLRKLLDHLPSNMKDFIRTRVFLHSHRRAYLDQSWCSSPMKKLRVRQYSLRQQTQSQLQNTVLAPRPSNIIDSLTQATLHLPFSCMGPLWTKVMFLTLENTDR
jgi:hypothetical protein